jgi:hypothetical protein
MHPTSADRIADIDAAWRPLNHDATLFATPEWLECNEPATGVQYHLFPALGGGIVVRRLQSTTFPGDNPLHCLLSEPLDAAADPADLARAGELRAALETLRPQLYPIATCGLPGGYLPGVVGKPAPDGYATALDELAQVGRQWQSPMTAVAHVPEDHPIIPALRERGYIGVPGLAQTILDVPPGSFDDYIARLPRSHRRISVRREWRAFTESGLKLREIDLADFSPEHAALHARQLRKYGHDISDQWLVNLIKRSAHYLGRWSSFVVAERDGHPEAFVICYEYGGQLHPKMSGFSAFADTCFGYFGLVYYDLVTRAQDRGVPEIVYGPGAYPAKLTRGCRLAPRTTFVRPVDPSLTPAMQELATIVGRSASWPTHQRGYQ